MYRTDHARSHIVDTVALLRWPAVPEYSRAMDTISKAALTAYLRNAELLEAACREALEANLGVLVIRSIDGSVIIEVTEDVPAGQIHEMRASRPQIDTQINERGLTPKPPTEQVPGEWNFTDDPFSRKTLVSDDLVIEEHTRSTARRDRHSW